MAENETSIEFVEGFLKARRKSLSFPPALERRFELDMRSRRTERLRANAIVTLLVYNLFLGSELVLTPDQLGLAAAIRFGIVSPWILFLAVWLRAERPRYLREGAAASIPLLIILQILLVFCASSSPQVEQYQYFILLPILFCSTIQRLPFAYTGAVAGCASAWHLFAVVVSGKMALPVGLMASATIIGCAYVSVVGNFYLERDFRRTYLHSLLDRLRLQQSNAASRRDALTGLANRRLLDERLEEIWRGNESSSPVAAILLDVDHFKAFNDSYGHVAGDACLKRIAACIIAELRGEDDLAVRFGGEEILLLLPRTDLGDAVRIAERIRRSIEALALPHKDAGPHQIVTASFGVASVPVPHLSSAELIAAADVALYAAKRKGRNQVWPPTIRPLVASESDASLPIRGAQLSRA